MHYCSQCGNNVQLEIPPGDNKPRYVCRRCDTIHYQNPKLVVGSIPELDGRLLLCRRAIEPRYGLWTLPAGFMEVNETAQEGAARETLEESGATVEIGNLYTMFNLPYVSQVYLLFCSRVLAQDVEPGVESLEINFFNEQDIPWANIAFPVVRETLWLYLKDRSQKNFRLHTGDIVRVPSIVSETTNLSTTSSQLRRYHVHLHY